MGPIFASMIPDGCRGDNYREKGVSPNQFAIFSFSHRHHEQPHPAPNAFMAQLKFSS
jgi:hypothetical protein